MLRLISLSSGSCGNAIYIETDKTKILVDAGTTLKYLGTTLKTIGVGLDEIEAVLLTHEHSDHIKSAGALSRRHKTKVWANTDTLDSLPRDSKQIEVRVFPMESWFEIGDLSIHAVPHSHDCRLPVGFMMYHRGKKICIATDLGQLTPDVANALKDADIIVLESNHDLSMLANGPYPPRLKARIAGKHGHLSNTIAGHALAGLASGREQKVLLAHISKENNKPELALKTVGDILNNQGIDSIKLGIAGRLVPSAIVA